MQQIWSSGEITIRWHLIVNVSDFDCVMLVVFCGKTFFVEIFMNFQKAREFNDQKECHVCVFL